MPVNLFAPDIETLFPIAGVRIGVTEAGVRKAGRKDLSVVLIDEGASVAGVFTTNRFCAAPVQICREHLAFGHGIRAMLINTGNANAGTADASRPMLPGPRSLIGTIQKKGEKFPERRRLGSRRV